MSIRLRVLLTFFGLVFVGVMAISSYSILFVRDYLLISSRDDLDRQARFLATLLVNQPDESQFPTIMADHARYTGHKVELLGSDLQVRAAEGAITDTTAPTFSGIAPLPGANTQERQYIRITASEAAIKATLTRVRYIIYGGILGTLLLTVAISWVVADRLTFPIRRLAGAARDVARGETFSLPRSRRRDEIGDLTRDVAAMADKLQEDISDLQRLNQAQEDFIAALSHEVRNPVFSARGYLEMALEEQAAHDDGSEHSKQMLEYLQKGHRNLLRIHNLFADMLLLVRLEFDQEPVALAPLSLGPVISELEETFLPQARERGIALTIRSETDAVQGNAEVLRIALSNLLANAIQHTEEGEVRLEIAQQDGGGVRLEVTDSGEGIPAHELESIFEKFHRVDKARSREAGGTGLGLALVTQCMRTLNTEIKVDSTVGQGSRFWFDLPAAQGE
ncbi:MAG: HAMP domain-containing protein [Candidatus Marinimicrobia bacterium]|nr:HAMP domain-containing protein [Candidatus Neomarinimicrobiota bacterium]